RVREGGARTGAGARGRRQPRSRGEWGGGAELQPHVRLRRAHGAPVMDLLSQHEAFLRAIFDAPDDDTPRLAYVDFLQENGEGGRAELIRVQCELAGLSDRPDEQSVARVELLSQREDEVAKRFSSPVQLRRRGFKTSWPMIRLGLGELQNAEEL